MAHQSIHIGYPINLEKKEIRLLYVHPGAWDEPIRCSMRVVSLLDEPPYSALSYVWGRDGDDCGIVVDGRELAIKPNLYTALRRIRAHARGDTTALWVDAVCIDQSDTLERNHQVGLMKDIYSQCSKCFIWLGEVERGGMQGQLSCNFERCVDLTGKHPSVLDSKWTELAAWNEGNASKPRRSRKVREADAPAFCLAELAIHMATACYLLQSGSHITKTSSPPRSCKADYEFLRDFVVNNPWFSRLWVVQEYTLPLRPVILLGPVALSLDNFSPSFSQVLLSHYRDECCWIYGFPMELIHELSKRFWTLSQLRQRVQKRFAYSSILQARLLLYGYLATDARDHVFGVSALCRPDATSKGWTMPDYSSTTRSLNTEVIREHISSHGSLGPLYVSSTKLSNPDTPSWVIDWTALSSEREEHDFLWLNVKTRFRASEGIMVNLGPEERFQDDVLTRPGLAVDRISACVRFTQKLAQPWMPHPQLEKLRGIVQKAYASSWNGPCDASWAGRPYAGDPSCSREDAWLRVLCLDHRDNDAMFGQGSCFSRIALGCGDNCLAESARDIWKAIVLSADPRPKSTCERPGHIENVEQIFRMIERMVPSNSVFITEKGYLGIAKDDGLFAAEDNEGQLRVGDGIFILAGGKMPFVLREVQSGNVSTADGEMMWKLINPCYVHGFMDGERNRQLWEEQGGYTTVRIV